ncbi:MAG TPA: carboxypeptidase M32 [Anaerolineales bacterium]|nr:carboxypeptidase M32 [Anaerolineales bacterium]
MKPPYPEFLSLMREISDLNKAASVLSWDRQTYMPPAGAGARTRQSATLARLSHERMTGNRLGDLLEALDGQEDVLDPDSTEASLVRWARHEYERSRRVPTALVTASAEASGAANVAWQKARPADDFQSFLPHIERMFKLAAEYAACFPEFAHPYDALLDRFEQGLTTEKLKRIFDEVKGPQSDLVQAIAGSGVAIDDGLLHQHFPRDAQLAASLEAAQALGYDLERGRLDLTTHPFASSFSVNDARITTRVQEDFLNTCLFGTLHETGHALYELGVAQDLDGLPLARGTSSGIHESQSRLFENLIGRSRSFAEFLLPLLQRHFPDRLGGVSAEAFYRSINKVEPSLIRVEADEVSYNLHIIIRFEIELALMEGNLRPADLPGAWREKFDEYLGITPPNDRLGVLQDVHWSWGLIGHFQSYALGNIISALWWREIEAVVGDPDVLMRKGEITPIREWLIENVHRHGRKYPPVDLIRRVTGGEIETRPYLAYLTEKYSAIYGL